MSVTSVAVYVGMPVTYRPHATEGTCFTSPLSDGPIHAAIITHVWPAGNLVNLAVFDSNGQAYGKTSVPIDLKRAAEPYSGRCCPSWLLFLLTATA